MNCIQYYSQLGIDLSPLSRDKQNTIASFFLENMIFTKEEIENLFKIEKSEKIEGGLADGKSVEEIATHHNTPVEQISEQLEMGIKVEMEHTNDKEKAEEIAKDHLWEIPDYYTRLKKMEEEAKGENFEKGVKAEIGEIRTWSGVKMQKTAQGWIPVKHDGQTANKENGGNAKSVEKPEEKEYSEKELADFARNTSTEQLKQASKGEDEKLRIAAKKELDRREKEETPKKEESGFEKVVEKFRSLSDEQVKFYLDAPYEDIKKAAKFIVDERGLTIEDKFEPLTLSSKRELDKFFEGFDSNSINELPSKELESLITYREDSSVINGSLRYGSIPNRNTKNIDSVFEKNLYKLHSDVIAYRGVRSNGNTDFLDGLKPGDVFQDKAFVSTTLSKNVGVDFISKKSFGDQSHTLLEIRLKKGQNIIPMQLVGEGDERVELMNEEYEILLNRDSKFKVLESTKENIDNRGELNKIIVELI